MVTILLYNNSTESIKASKREGMRDLKYNFFETKNGTVDENL